MLGGGSAFESGGPGRGFFSLLSSYALPMAGCQHVKASVLPSALHQSSFAIEVGASNPFAVSQVVGVVGQCLGAVKEGLQHRDAPVVALLDRSRLMAERVYRENAESVPALSTDACAQLLHTDRWVQGGEFIRQLKEATPESVCAAVSAIQRCIEGGRWSGGYAVGSGGQEQGMLSDTGIAAALLQSL
ncbi:hypothetical protein KIPB_002743 [Kipferlia bialata]|uniref:Uncharacterized protein n=1 Tax=Kipferlia bialata TaxID=797122 RepID=A0A391NK90_9EUKA|nr:hypothetical protein KIPB_002743 [Kipferlia bialata]|eukprot:g2743.t1